jgi:hypothetical protein
MAVLFHEIPETNLEIASAGSGNSRILFIKEREALFPLNVAEGIRIILIGQPHREFRDAMADGRISRPKLADIIEGAIGGSTYQRLRNYLDITN